MKHFLKLAGFSLKDASWILDRAVEYKARRFFHHEGILKDQTWALLFSKPSTRTRLSFEVAVRELGGQTIFMSAQEIQMGRGEPVKDTARVFGRMAHGAIIRTFAQQDVEDFAKFGELPTINGLTDDEHPCQILADIMTFVEKEGPIQGRKVVFIGDAACNVARSWVYAAEIFDFELVCAAPEGFEPGVTNKHTCVVRDPLKAAANADLLYTDVWVSMGKEEEAAQRIKAFEGYQINDELLKKASPNALVLHCLPAYRGKEITEKVLEDRAEDIFDQAENRLHVQKAILHWCTQTNLESK